MKNKSFILNADDFGLSIPHNLAVFEGYNKGILTSASLCANGSVFNDAVYNVLPQCQNLGLAVHLNIMEGKSLTSCPLLTDSEGNFNKTYWHLLLNQNNKKLLIQIEDEFEAQIEKVLKYSNVDHLDSHIHTHAIPSIFKIVSRLAKKYNINYIRTQFEDFYLIPKTKLKPINFIKILLLNFFTIKNKMTLKRYGLKTNDNIIGVGYTGMMNSDTIEYGLKTSRGNVVEAVIHPCKYLDSDVINSHSKEFEITQDKTLKETIKNLGFNFTNYTHLENKISK